MQCLIPKLILITAYEKKIRIIGSILLQTELSSAVPLSKEKLMVFAANILSEQNFKKKATENIYWYQVSLML